MKKALYQATYSTTKEIEQKLKKAVEKEKKEKGYHPTINKGKIIRELVTNYL